MNPTEDLPYAGVRFINAVPDTGASFGLDLRFVDLFESNAHFRITFRNSPGTVTTPNTAGSVNVSTSIQYKGARQGARQFRIFLDDTIQTIASVVLKDTTVNLTRDLNYTAMLWGNARSTNAAFAGQPGGDKMALAFWQEDVTAPTAGRVKLRVINATSTALDVWAFTTTPAATATWAAVAPYSRSTYVEVDSGSYSYRVRNAGSATNLFGDTRVLGGQVPTCSGRPATDYTATNPSGCPTDQPTDIEALPGTKVAGSAVTGIVFPASVAGSLAAQFTTPAITYVWDRRPPRTCDPLC